MFRPFLNGLAALLAVLAFFVLLRVTWSPDPMQSLFIRAEQLENAGQIALSMRHYALIADQHPESIYAPRALLRQGDLLAAEGIRSGERATFERAVAMYSRLAKSYPRDRLVSEALLDAGQISLENLEDMNAAKTFYEQLLEKAGAKSDMAATATLKLGRIALDRGDGKQAQTLLQRVLQRWPNLTDRGAEAQFTLGVAYETLFKNKEWATRAYNATIERYPNSTWANSARQKLGLLVYSTSRGKRPARRVIVQIDALPDDGASNGSLWSALRLVMAAHGVEVSDTTLSGWSLAPFYAGFDPLNPGRVVKAEIDSWENVVANAGLRFSIQSGGKKEADALRDLQDEIDAARVPLVYFEENGAKTWALCVGYDSDRSEVMLQRRGARFDTLNAKSFATYWSAKSSFGQPFTLISLVPTDQKTRLKPSLTPTPQPSAKSTDAGSGGASSPQLAAPDSQSVPTFYWELPKISLKNVDSRARKRAATILMRARSGTTLMGAFGLERLANELERVAQARPKRILEPTSETSPDLNPTPMATNSNAIPDAESPYAPEVTPTPAATSTPAPRLNPERLVLRNDEERARALLSFFGAPAQSWAQSRREAAAWCDEASKRSKDPAWQRARDYLRASAEALEEAISLAPSSLSSPLGAGDRAQIGEAARQIERARDAERDAARALAS